MADSLDFLWSMRSMFLLFIAYAYLRLTWKLDTTDIVRITYLLSSVCSVNPSKILGNEYNKGVSHKEPLLVSLLALFQACFTKFIENYVKLNLLFQQIRLTSHS